MTSSFFNHFFCEAVLVRHHQVGLNNGLTNELYLNVRVLLLLTHEPYFDMEILSIMYKNASIIDRFAI